MEWGRPAWIEVDRAAIRHNVRRIQEYIGPRCGVLAVVKANGYGHGLLEAARAALEGGAAGLAVAIASEGLILRHAGITAPILVMGSTEPDLAATLVAHDVAAGVDSLAEAESLSAAAARLNKSARVHLKIDSGMGRRGVLPEAALALAQQIRALPGVLLEAVFSHFASADDDLEYTRAQLHAFDGCLGQIRAGGPARAHLANSPGLLRLPEAHYDFVRPGLLLYGVYPYPGAEAVLDVRPAMQIKARLAAVKRLPAEASVGYGRTYRMSRDGRIAIVPLGYGDGFSRRSSNNGDVLVRGRRAPICGRVCMDQFMVDVTDVPEAQAGDEAVVLGGQGELQITAGEIAERTGTIPYETLAALTDRLPRQYVG